MARLTQAASALLIGLACLAFPERGVAQPLPVDAQIVLAVDVSRSVDGREVAVQREGYIAALRHPELARAIAAGRHGRIAIAYFEWSGYVDTHNAVSWHLVDGPEAAEALADAIAGRPAAILPGTSISRAIAHGMTLLEDNRFSGGRRVIDVSADGPNNLGPPVRELRDAAVGRGITVNGLPVLIRPSGVFPAMDDYFAACVIGGYGAFLLPVRARDELASAIRRKLILEISSLRPPRLVPAALAEVDCLIGERTRERSGGPYYPGIYE